ncbi:hypothetical protein ERO13_D03G058950v2 [Gossypium hirsutum]|nr:hypothetical protein ERO13_D03G058950v2 [Gossypium hirsutum]
MADWKRPPKPRSCFDCGGENKDSASRCTEASWDMARLV